MKVNKVVAVLIFCTGFAFTAKSQHILDKLSKVEEGKILNGKNSWVVTSSNTKIYYEEFKGKWLLIDFWSTGCIPCIKEFPKLEEFSSKFDKEKLQAIAVSVDNKLSTYIKSAKKYKIGIAHYYGGFTFDNDLFNLNVKAFKTDDGQLKFNTSTPQYVLIDPDGMIVDKNLPKPSSPDFLKKIEEYIKK